MCPRRVLAKCVPTSRAYGLYQEPFFNNLFFYGDAAFSQRIEEWPGGQCQLRWFDTTSSDLSFSDQLCADRQRNPYVLVISSLAAPFLRGGVMAAVRASNLSPITFAKYLYHQSIAPHQV